MGPVRVADVVVFQISQLSFLGILGCPYINHHILYLDSIPERALGMYKIERWSYNGLLLVNRTGTCKRSQVPEGFVIWQAEGLECQITICLQEYMYSPERQPAAAPSGGDVRLCALCFTVEPFGRVPEIEDEPG